MLIFILFISLNAHAFKFSQKTCQEYGLGPQWYCESEKIHQNSTTLESIMEQNILPEQKSEMLNQLWEVQRKRAVITGTKQDLENLLITQKFIAKLGADFARKMMRLVETHPEHSENNSYYQNISNEYIEEAKKNHILKNARDRFAIAFIYSDSCPYCERQLPILKSLKEQTNIKLLGISVSGKYFDGLDQNIFDPNVTQDVRVKAFPTIMLLDLKREMRIFIAKGLITKDQLEQRIYKTILEMEEWKDE